MTFADVDALHRKISKRAPTHANRVLALLSRMFTMAIRWGMRTDNPGERHRAQRRGQAPTLCLTGAELTRLSAALAELRDQGAANAVRLLLLTGARRGELLAAKWADIDLEAGDLDQTGPAPRSSKRRTPSRCRRRRADCSPRCARRPAMMPSSCSLPASRRIASTSTTLGPRCARPPTSRTIATA